MKKLHDRSYQLVTQGGQQITRNRRDLKAHPGNVEVKFKTSPPVNSTSDVRNVPKVPVNTKMPESTKMPKSTEVPKSVKVNKSPVDQGNRNVTTAPSGSTGNYMTRSGRPVRKPAHFPDK